MPERKVLTLYRLEAHSKEIEGQPGKLGHHSKTYFIVNVLFRYVWADGWPHKILHVIGYRVSDPYHHSVANVSAINFHEVPKIEQRYVRALVAESTKHPPELIEFFTTANT
jgi:hypothetical protein